MRLGFGKIVWLKEGIEVEKTTEKVAICLRLGIIEKKIKKVGSLSEVRKMVWLKEGIEVEKTQKKWQFVLG